MLVCRGAYPKRDTNGRSGQQGSGGYAGGRDRNGHPPIVPRWEAKTGRWQSQHGGGAGDTPRPSSRVTGSPSHAGGGGEKRSARNSGVRGALRAQGIGDGTHLRAVTPWTLTKKLLSNPHSTLRRSVHFFEPMAEKENTSHSRGEKWWGSEGVENPNLTAQPSLLDGAEGEMLSPAATVNVEGITAGKSSDMNAATMPLCPSGASTDPPQSLFLGLEPPRIEATGGRVTGADTPKHRIENKFRRRALLASQQPQTQWRVYQGDFDLPDPVAPSGKNVPGGLGSSSPRRRPYGCPTQTGKP